MASHHGVEHRGELVPIGTVFSPGRFGRMFPQLPPLIVDVTALDQLAGAMVDNAPALEISVTPQPGDNGNITAGYTYLGQFVDHDITLDTTSLSERPIDPQAVFNFRTPKLELDSLYAIGPGGQPFMYDRSQPAKFIIGRTVSGRGDPTIPAGMPNDLPRSEQGFALIGDLRNDENLLVAQLHLAFLKFHNKVVDGLIAQGVGGDELFERARQTVRWHYQWIVLHDFVGRLVDLNVLHSVLNNGREFFLFAKEPFMPVEFSVAAYRLGHSMVREEYNHNRVFRPGPGAAAPGSLALLFRFTGLSGSITGAAGGLAALPSDWIIDWRRFFDFQTNDTRPNQGFGLNFSRLINPLIVPALHTLPGGGGSLPARNLRRGVRMQLPSGQKIAKAMKIKALTPDEIAQGPDGAVAREHGLDVATPLWYYILKEAGVEAGGARLGQLGSRILSEVFVGMLEGDPESFLAQDRNWQPTLPAANPGTFTMTDLLTFVDDINPIN
jgi:hypothetical protein